MGSGEEDELAQARAEMDKLEAADEVPSDPKDWPSGKAKYITYDVDGDQPYGEGATAKLGPAEVAHQEDGSITVGGEQVDNPDDYRGERIQSDAIDVADSGSAGRERND